MAPVKKHACIGLLVLLCSSFGSASRILLDHSPDDQKQKDAVNHNVGNSPRNERGGGGFGYARGTIVESGAGVGYGYGSGSGGSGIGYGAGSGGGGTGIGYGAGSGSGGGIGIGQGSGTGIGIGSGSGAVIPGVGVIPGAGGTGTGIGIGTGGGIVIPGIGVIPGTGNTGTDTGVGIGSGGAGVIPVVPGVGCGPGLNCPNAPTCGRAGSNCNQPISGCTCPPWKAESNDEAHKVTSQDGNPKMAKEAGEPAPKMEKEASVLLPLDEDPVRGLPHGSSHPPNMPDGIPYPPNMLGNSANQGHE